MTRTTLLAATLALYVLPGAFRGARAGTDTPAASTIPVDRARAGALLVPAAR